MLCSIIGTKKGFLIKVQTVQAKQTSKTESVLSGKLAKQQSLHVDTHAFGHAKIVAGLGFGYFRNEVQMCRKITGTQTCTGMPKDSSQCNMQNKRISTCLPTKRPVFHILSPPMSTSGNVQKIVSWLQRLTQITKCSPRPAAYTEAAQSFLTR